jgi:hypothetical protein
VLTDANLRIDRRTGQVVSVSADNRIVTQDVAKDPAQTAILNKYTTSAAPIANRGSAPRRRHSRASRTGPASRSSATSSPTPSSPQPRRAASAALWWRS